MALNIEIQILNVILRLMAHIGQARAAHGGQHQSVCRVHHFAVKDIRIDIR